MAADPDSEEEAAASQQFVRGFLTVVLGMPRIAGTKRAARDLAAGTEIAAVRRSDYPSAVAGMALVDA
jgi:hypothetical protein